MQWIYERPKLVWMIGRALFSVGGLTVVSGLIGRAGMTALNQARSIGKMPPYSGLSEAYPMYPLWWVPEHFLGYAIGALIAGTGLYLALMAKSALKVVRGGKGRYG
ncbi:hypothetical protein [Polaromonas sp. JS666]|uniref:hypothetical protein n=1 Tax=Polaromonas sp. (strain JS666 / ATCC BAA-500) TaxID=296591 RepID=UPI001113D0BA|nr:hypothetical protein [Polaromonas sp. JS666]